MTKREAERWMVTAYVAKSPVLWREVATALVPEAIRELSDEDCVGAVVRVAPLRSDGTAGAEVPARRWCRERGIKLALYVGD